MYAKVKNGIVEKYPYTVDDLRRDNPNTSFPAVPSAALYAEFGVVPVVVTGAPEHDTATHIVESTGCAYNAERERWETQWVMRELTPTELAARVPRSVSMRQARLALLQFGLLANIDAALAAIPGDLPRQAAQIEWEYAAAVERDSTLVQQLGGALGLTDQQLDQLFTLAASL